MNDNMKYYIVGLALGATIGVSGTMAVITKRKIKNLTARMKAREILIADMHAMDENLTIDDIINILQRSSDIDNMPI